MASVLQRAPVLLLLLIIMATVLVDRWSVVEAGDELCCPIAHIVSGNSRITHAHSSFIH